MSKSLKILFSVLGLLILVFIFINLSKIDFNSGSSSSSSSKSSSTSSSVSISATKQTSLETTILKEGTGDKVVKIGDTIDINYLGTLENGKKFDSSYDRGTPFSTQIGVGRVIPGWDQGVIGMKVGEKRKLVIPPALGYGSAGQGSIPPNSTLIFEVELMGIK